MKRSTVIIGIGLCGIAYLFGRDHSNSPVPRPTISQLVSASDPTMTKPLPATAAQVIGQQLPDRTTRLAQLEREYRDHAGFRQLVADYNAETGHPGRGKTASLMALDRDAVAGTPAFALLRAVQPRAEIVRAFDRHWRDERGRRGGTFTPNGPATLP